MNKTRFITCLTILMIGLLPLCSTSYAGQVSSTTKARSPKRGKLLKKPNKKKVKRGTFLKNKALTFTVVIAVTLLGGWGVKKFVLEIQERRKEEVEEPIQEDILTPKKTEVKKPEQVEKPKKLYVPKIVYNKRVIREIKEESAEVKGFEALIQQRFDEDVINEWKKFKLAVLHDYMPSSKEEANKLLTYSFAKEKIWGGGGEIPRASKVKDKEYMFKMDSGLCRLCGHYVLRQTIASEINNLKAKYSTLTKEKIYRCKPVGKKLFLMLGSYYFGTDIRAYNHVKEHFDYDKAEEILFKRLDFRYELFQRFIQSKYLYDYTAYQGLGKQFQDMGDTFQSFIRNQKFSLEQLGSTRIKIMTEEEEQNREIQIDKYNARISYVGYFIIGELLASDTVHEAMGREDLSDVGQELYKNVVYNSSLDSGSAQDPNYFIVQEALSSKSSKAKKEYSLVWYDTEIR